MNNKPTWWQIFKIKLSLGRPFARVEDLGLVDSSVIRFNDLYLNIMQDPETGDIKSFSWSRDPHMFPDVNINEHYKAVR